MKMDNNNKGQVTFELSDLSYNELISVYKEISEFIVFIENVIENSTEEKKKKGE